MNDFLKKTKTNIKWFTISSPVIFRGDASTAYRDPAILFFHGSEYPETNPRGGFDNYASIALAWSSDLKEWFWPGKLDGE
jgi:hypothetical protein